MTPIEIMAKATSLFKGIPLQLKSWWNQL